jgi:hypothetical protein
MIFDVLADGAVVGRIMKAAAAPVGAPCAVDHPILRRSSADARLQGEARDRDGGVRQELAEGVVQLKPTTEVEATSILPL